MNSLIGVLLCLPNEKIAMVSDIKATFHQGCVDPPDQDFLRFLWWPRRNTSLPTDEYCMKVHLFSATLSPSCANFALLQTAENNSYSYEPSIAETIKRNFYMDDCLKSVASKAEAMNLYQQLTDLLKKEGFHLTKWISSCSEVLDRYRKLDTGYYILDTSTEKSSSAFSLNEDENLHVLSVKWEVTSDKFRLETNPKTKSLTRRGA